ncbi:hypothetical protein [Arthrobacter mangrovi]|uniref:Cation-transporting ATPase n=1 Tax=Arthrobacter mangrovi TaxID=2966350 RepID=A0ABQ5MZK1_9MICC|nr:hypothetical protein [Arthrobacter mangrovi]GLB69411.1 hypothetical protein AHIS1636_38550 [Arthrobacter mangrovi]
MFDKLVRKGKTMAMQYAKEQLSRRTGQQHPSGGTQGYGQNQGYGQHGYGQNQGYGQSSSGQDQGYGGRQYPSAPNQPGGRPPQGQGQDADQAAIAKYKYMLHTAPPQDMERAHAEAFSRLTPQQRAMLRDELNSQLPPSEHANSDRPEVLARTATRAEVSRPGFMERILGRGGQGGGRLAAGAAGAAGGLGAGLLAGVAAGFVGSAIAGPLLEGFSGIGEGIAGAAEGVGDGIASAGEGFGDQGGFGGFFGDADGGFGDFEL